MSNTLKTTALLAALTALLVFVGDLLGRGQGAILAFGLAIVMNVGAYWFSDKIVLRQYGAKEIEPGSLPRVERIIDNLVARAGLPRPKIYLIDEPQPNAFATGRNPQHAAVAVTKGIVELMDDEQLEGVLAHELAHVRHRDILTSTVAATLAGAVMMLASMARWGMIFGGFGGNRDERGGGGLGLLVGVIVAPIAATLVQLAVSRSREFAADAGAVELTKNPMGMARALKRLGRASGRIPMDASPQTAHMFIVSPFGGLGGVAKLFATHPPLEERIHALVGDQPVS